MPEIVNQSYGQIDNINTEFNINDITIDNNKVTLKLNDLDIKEGDEVRLEMKKKGIKNYISVSKKFAQLLIINFKNFRHFKYFKYFLMYYLV